MPLSSRPSNYSLRSVQTPPTEPEQPQDLGLPTSTTREPGFFPMAGAFRMEDFYGDGTQDIVRYLRRFDEYVRATALKDEQAVASLAWHLKGLARLWYESQNIRPERINELKDMLVAKFKIEKEASLDIYTMKQSPGETLNQFLNRLEQATYINNIPENVQVQIALKGMEGMVGQAMGAHAPKTLQEVRNLAARMGDIHGNIGDRAQINVTETSKLEQTVEQLVAAVTRLTTEKNREGNNEDRHYKNKQQQAVPSCHRCGGRCYSANSCRAMGKTCYKCNKLNHFGNKCRSSKFGHNNNSSFNKKSWNQSNNTQ